MKTGKQDKLFGAPSSGVFEFGGRILFCTAHKQP